jgi:hypothetical protein
MTQVKKNVCRNMFMYSLILAFFLLAFTTSPAFSELKLESVYPNQVVLGQDLEVTLKGTGFDKNTRVSMALDVWNKKTIMGSVDTPGKAFGVAVVGDTAYVADFSSGLQVIDISNPASPQIIGAVDTPGKAVGVTVVGDTAYVAEYGSGLQVIDISDPADPQIIGSVNTPGLSSGVAVVGNIAYVTDENSGLQVIDIKDPADPQIIGSVDTGGAAKGVTVVGDIAYVADNLSGLQVIDISNLAAPQIIGSVDTLGYAHDVTVVGNTAYAADGDNGLVIVPLLSEITPVTMNTETGISVNLPSPAIAGNYTLQVFNGKERFEIDGAVNFSTLDLASIDPNDLVIQTQGGVQAPETLDQDQDLYLQLIYVDPQGIPFNLSNLPHFKVEWLSSHPQALSINPLALQRQLDT